MRPEDRELAHLWDMRRAATAAVSFVQGKTFGDYAANLLLRSAVERQVEIIGEAARRLTREFRDRHPEVPWVAIMAQRHVLAHEYDDIQHETIWRVVTVHVPALLEQLAALLPREDVEDA